MSALIFFLAFLLRIFFVPHPGFKADIAYWKWWGMSAAHDGIVGPLIHTAYNYPSFYLYILKATSHLYEFITGYNYQLDQQSTYFWNDSNLLYLFLIKLPYILADLGIGILIYKIVKMVLPFHKKNSFTALLAASFYLFNPVVIYNSALWGQTDSLGSLFVLLSFYFLLKERFLLVGIFAAISVFMKTQTIIFLPLFFLAGMLLSKKPVENLIRCLWVFFATVIVINLPFLANHLMDRVFDIMYTSQLYFPYVSMNAYNLWWIFFGKNSSSFLDQQPLLSFLTYKTAGVLLFGFFYSLSLTLFVQTKNITDTLVKTKIFLSALIIASFAFFLVLTQMHERYLFPLFAFYPILLGLEYINKNKTRFLFLTSCFLILSILILLNLHQVMIMNYPDNTLPFFPNVFSEELTKIVAFLNLIIFIVLVTLLTQTISFTKKILILLLFILLITLNAIPSLWNSSKNIISLSKIKPISQKQGFGTLAVNRNLSNNWLASLYYYSFEGLATHAYSEIVYNLNGNYHTFTSMYGVDNSANTNATVIFVIKDEKGRQLYKSPKITRFSLPGYLKVNVKGVQKLYLIVEDAGDGINSDHADWLDPRLYK